MLPLRRYLSISAEFCDAGYRVGLDRFLVECCRSPAVESCIGLYLGTRSSTIRGSRTVHPRRTSLSSGGPRFFPMIVEQGLYYGPQGHQHLFINYLEWSLQKHLQLSDFLRRPLPTQTSASRLINTLPICGSAYQSFSWEWWRMRGRLHRAPLPRAVFGTSAE